MDKLSIEARLLSHAFFEGKVPFYCLSYFLLLLGCQSCQVVWLETKISCLARQSLLIIFDRQLTPLVAILQTK